MVLEPVLCAVCQQAEAVYRHGKATDGTQRYRCSACRRTFQLRYRHKAGGRARITDLALNGSGIRNTARVLGISTQAVMAELKKNHRRKPASARAPGLRARPGRRAALVRRRDVVLRGL